MPLFKALKLSKRIKQLKKEYGFTQEKLSEVAKIDYKYLQRIEDKNPPNAKLEILERIAKVFDISVGELLNF